MNSRSSAAISTILHAAVIALLCMISLRTPLPEKEPEGMEIEISDLEQALPDPSPALAKSETDQLDQAPQQSQSQNQPAPAAMAPPAPQQVLLAPAVVAAKPQPVIQPAPVVPVQQPQSLGVGPVSQVRPAPPAAPAAPKAPPRPMLNAGALSGMLAAKAGQGRQTSINSAALGSLIGKAAPKGAAGLTARQRANLAEMVRSQVTPCWNPPSTDGDTGSVSVVMSIQLDRGGNVVGVPAVASMRGQTAANATYARALAGSVRRAIVRCAPLRLPAELFDAWNRIELNFDPKDVS